MEGYCSTGQSPKLAVVPMEEEEEEEEEAAEVTIRITMFTIRILHFAHKVYVCRYRVLSRS
jgi:hypothetical protein